MRLRSGKIIYMADEVSNVNGGSSTNDSLPVIVQQADVTSRSEGVTGSESIAVTTAQTGSVGRNIHPRGTLSPFQPPLTAGWPPYGLPPGYTSPVGNFVPPVRFVSVNGGNNSQNPQQHSEYSCDYNMGSTSNAANSMAVYRQQVEESHHDLVNLLTQQMTTILNPTMADHESKFERLARQVERIARIVDYEKGERHNARGNNEGFENIFQNKNNVFNQENPHVVPRDQNADDLLARLRANHGGERYQVTRIVEEVLHRVGLNVSFMNRPHFVSAFPQVVQMAEVLRGVKNPKIITKFVGEVGELTTEHVARYLVEIGNLANDENLKMNRDYVLGFVDEILPVVWIVPRFWVGYRVQFEASRFC
ncbi:hypothetical protein Ahy_B10g102112 [Arachis hypogaea]|uniref:Uncharacterized protein n=1 Tax=Arachis hypogaea TaxID=3818 RepID=A0A444X193_ARAHY|nr:hypothetical protein Ahy_B10g102112 [Arachis hypogaea]